MTTETPARSDIGTRKHDLLTLAAGRPAGPFDTMTVFPRFPT